MVVSLVKESRVGEKRVLLLPEHLAPLTDKCTVIVERGAGKKLGISDKDYENIGARIVEKEIAWQADFVLKLKRPSIEELASMKDGASIAAMLHAEAAPDMVDVLIQKKVTSYSFEYVQDESGRFPLMRATGEISGKQAVIYAAYHLQSHLKGSGRMLASCANVAGAKVAILGFGNVGQAAAELAISMGAEVCVFRWQNYTQPTEKVKDTSVDMFPWDKEILHKVIADCDVVIGAIRISTFDTPVFFDNTLLSKMRKGSVIVDVTAGYGSGYIEPSDDVTALQTPYRIVNGVKIIKIRQLPLGVHYTAAKQISSVYAPFIYQLVERMDYKNTEDLQQMGMITNDGRIVNSEVLKHHKIQFNE